MADLIENKNTAKFRKNISKVAIYHASGTILEELNNINRRGLRSLQSYIPNDGSLAVDISSLTIQFLPSDYLDALDRINCAYLENQETLSALISLYLIQETGLNLDFQDCPNPKLVKKLHSQGFKYNPLKRSNPSREGGFSRNTHNSIFVTFIPTDLENNIENKIRRNLQNNTDLNTETDLASYLIAFPEKDNELWLRDKSQDFKSENYLESLIHEYVHLLYGQISSGNPPAWLDEAFAWFVGREIGQDLGVEVNLDSALNNYGNKETLKWSINFLRDSYHRKEDTVTLLSWTQKLMLELEEDAEKGHSQALLKIILPEELSRRIDKVNEIFNEEAMDKHEEFLDAFTDLSSYHQKLKRNYKVDRERADNNLEELKPYFESYEIVIERLNQIQGDLDISEEDIRKLDPKRLKVALTSNILEKAGEQKMSVREVEQEFERTLESEINQFMKLYKILKRTDRDILNQNISPERLSDRFIAKIDGEIDSSGLLVVHKLRNAIEDFIQEVESVESELENLSFK